MSALIIKQLDTNVINVNSHFRYYAIGLLKFCTFGFFLLGQLVDIILIATQTVGPADGSDYLISQYGPILSKVGMENHTFYQYGSYYYKQQFLTHDEH